MWKYCILLAVFCGVYLSPPPEGLSLDAWKLFGVYATAILGIMLRPQAEPVVMMVVIAVGGLFVPIGTLLSGFANPTVWLVFSAFLISQAFVETGLGRRIGYHMIGLCGRSTLGLSYGIVITDLLISPATPSNTARSGGIVYPIFRSVCSVLGSEPGPTGRKIGGFVTLLSYQVSLITASLFITACAPNILVVNFARDILKTEISWMLWAQAAFVPGMIALFTAPLIVYKLYAPELKHIPDFKEISSNGLKELGPMTRKEYILIALFVLAILGWALGTQLKLNTTTVALLFFAGSVLFGLVTWDQVLQSKGAWSTIIWYGGIVGISAALANQKFFVWLAKVMQGMMHFQGFNSIALLAVLLGISLGIRYLFASQAAYTVAFVPVVFTIGLAAGAPLYPLALLMAFFACIGALLTHYGGAVAPVLFGTGYVDQGTWWKVGAVIVLFNAFVYMTIGLLYWKLLGLW